MLLRLSLASHLDLWEQRGRRLLEKYGWPQAWLNEFINYRGDPRMTIEEFWVRFTLKRIDAEATWFKSQEMSEEQAYEYYTTCDYMLWRNLVHRRHTAWRRVLWMLPQNAEVKLLEYGCGIAPVSAYCARARPDVWYSLVDLPGPAWRYGYWRVENATTCERQYAGSPSNRIIGEYHVITALDVFEHLADPLTHAQELVQHLRPGGLLHWNFVGNERSNDLDLASDKDRDATILYLTKTLDLCWEAKGYRVSRKR